MPAEKWVSVREVSSHLGMSISLVRKRMYDSVHPIPHRKIPGGRSVKFRISEIDDWIQEY